MAVQCPAAQCSVAHMLLLVELMGLAELVKLFGVSKTRVEQFVKEDGFPEAHRVGAQRVRVWDRDAVIEWARSRPRPRELHLDNANPPAEDE